MRSLEDFQSGKPGSYPDQSVCAEYGLTFQDIDDGTGLVFSVASPTRTIYFGAGRCSWYPQNNATASTLASDKYFTHIILERAGAPALGGEYFFLHDRHRAHRPAGHEREDALEHFRKLDASAFVKPLLGSRGDFAQAIHGEASFRSYLDEVAQSYDSILIQRIVSGAEYRVFLLDDEIVYTARKYPPSILGDGVRSIGDLLTAHNAALRSRGLSPVAVTAVDMFADIGGDPEAMRVIEVNSNPSIRLLEQSGRSDLILKIWHHTFSAMGLIGV